MHSHLHLQRTLRWLMCLSLTLSVMFPQEKQQAKEEQLTDLREQVNALQQRQRSLETALRAAEQVRAQAGLLVSAVGVQARCSTAEDATHASTDRTA